MKKLVVLCVSMAFVLAGCSLPKLFGEDEATEETQVEENNTETTEEEVEEFSLSSEDHQVLNTNREDKALLLTKGEENTEKYIDVFSWDFKNAYFAGPEAFQFDAVEKGMSQSEVEDIFGTPDTTLLVKEKTVAVYGNHAVRYSEGAPYLESIEPFNQISADENTVEAVDVYFGVPHETLVNEYGAPTWDYNQYEINVSPVPRMIYDATRDNGYAVFVHVEGKEDKEDKIATIMYKGDELSEEAIVPISEGE